MEETVAIESYIPEFFIKRSFAVKTGVIIAGAILLLFSTIIRPIYPFLWIFPFAFGALIEWIIVATVYVEITQIERETKRALREIEQTKKEIQNTQSEIQEVQREIEETKENIFSFASDSQGPGVKNSIEDRVSELEKTVGTGRSSIGDNLKSRVENLEAEIDQMRRGFR